MRHNQHSKLKFQDMKKKNKEALKITKIARYSSSKFEATKGGKEKLVTKLVDIVPKTQKVQDILEQAMEMSDNPIIFLGYEDHIIGYDTTNNALVYDALCIINQITDENMKYDEEHGTNDLNWDWEDYYDHAAEFVNGSHLTKVSLITGKNEASTTEETVNPILMTYFLVD